MNRVAWLVFAHLLLVLSPGSGVARPVAPASAPPLNFKGVALSQTSITWSWADTLGETRYLLHDEHHGLIAELSQDTVEFSETGLSENTSYSRHIHSREFGIESSPSNIDLRFTLVHTASTGDFSVAASSPTSVQIIVAEPPSAHSGMTGVEITRTAPTAGTITSFSQSYQVTDDHLSPATEYCYTIQFCNGDGIPSGSPGTSLCVTLPPPDVHDDPFKYCTIGGINGPVYLYLKGDKAKAADGTWEVVRYGTGDVEWKISKATKNINLRARSGGEFKEVATGAGTKIQQKFSEEGVFLIEARCKGETKYATPGLLIAVLDVPKGDKCLLREIKGPSGLCMMVGGMVKGQWKVYGDNMEKGKAVKVELTPVDGATVKVTELTVDIEFKKTGKYTLKATCHDGDPALSVSKDICVTTLKSVSGPTRITLDSKFKKPSFTGRWSANLDPDCDVDDLNWSINPGTDPEKGNGKVALSTVKKAGDFTITFKCGAASASLKFKVSTGSGLKITGPRLKIKPVDALGPTGQVADAAALAAQQAVPRKAKWTITAEGEVSYTWYLMRLPDGASHSDPLPTPNGKNSETGTTSPIQFNALTPGCYVILVIGAQAEGDYSAYATGDVPNGVYRFYVVEADLDVVVDCDQRQNESMPHALPKLYPETVAGADDQDDLLSVAPKLPCCSAMRFRLVTVPSLTLDFSPGGVLTADDDGKGFTGLSKEPENCSQHSSRKDFFKLTSKTSGTHTIKLKAPNGDAFPYVKIDYSLPAKEREVTLNFYFVSGDAGKATSALVAAGAAAQSAYIKEMIEVANAYWSQVGICFIGVNNGERKVNVDNPTPDSAHGTLNGGTTTSNNVFVVPDAVNNTTLGNALIDSYPKMRIMVEDPHLDCSDNAANTLAHELLHAMAGLPQDHAGMTGDDLGASSSGIEGSNISPGQTTAAQNAFDNN